MIWGISAPKTFLYCKNTKLNFWNTNFCIEAFNPQICIIHKKPMGFHNIGNLYSRVIQNFRKFKKKIWITHKQYLGYSVTWTYITEYTIIWIRSTLILNIFYWICIDIIQKFIYFRINKTISSTILTNIFLNSSFTRTSKFGMKNKFQFHFTEFYTS